MNSSLSQLRYWLVAVLLAFGFGFAWAIAVLWISNISSEVWGNKEFTYEYLSVRSDGTPFIVRNTTGEVRLDEYFTIEGEPVEIDEDAFRNLGGSYSAPRSEETRDVSHNWQRRISAINDGDKPPTFWYCMHDGKLEGSAYFVGYDSRVKRIIGYVGSQGFQPNMPSASNQFPMRLHHGSGVRDSLTNGSGPTEPSHYSTIERLFFLSDGNVFRFEPKRKKIEVVWKDDSAFHVSEIGYPAQPLNPNEVSERPTEIPEFVLLRRDDSLVIADIANQSSSQYTIPEAARTDRISVFRLQDDELLIAAYKGNDKTTSRQTLYWLDNSSKVIREHELQLKGYIWRSPDAPLLEPQSAAIALPIPLAMTVLPTIAVPLIEVQRGLANDFAAARRAAIVRWWPIWLATHILAAIAAIWVWKRHQTFALTGGWMWAILVFAGGLPGLVGYLFHRRWPTRIACESCGKATVVNHATCQHCKTDFPAAARTGTEVLVELPDAAVGQATA